MPGFNASVIREHAHRLYERSDGLAWSYAIRWGLTGGVSGGAAGALGSLFMAAGFSGGVVLLAAAAAALCGGVLGYAHGHELGFRFRLEAQMALCQVEIAENTRIAAEILMGAEMRERGMEPAPLPLPRAVPRRRTPFRGWG